MVDGTLRSAEARAVVRQLNRLIGSCRDDISVNSAAAMVVQGAAPRAQLAERARRRKGFVVELGNLVQDLGGTALNRGSALVSVRGSIHRLRAFAFGENDSDEYGQCSRVETKTEETYAAALESPLPEGVRSVVGRQHDEIENDRVELRRLQFYR